MLEINAKGFPMLSLRLAGHGDEVIVDCRDLLEWQGYLIDRVKILEALLAKEKLT